jgi:hypothetical protein
VQTLSTRASLIAKQGAVNVINKQIEPSAVRRTPEIKALDPFPDSSLEVEEGRLDQAG